MCTQIDTADAQIVPTPDKPRTQRQRMPVCVDRFLAAPAVRQSGAQFIPQQRIFRPRDHSGLETIHRFVVLARQVE